MISPASLSRKDDLAHFAPEVLRGLDQLARAADYAQDLGNSLWEFAVEIDRLLALGMTTSDLRWLAKRGYVIHGREVTSPRDAVRRFEPPEQNLAFSPTTCFVLTAGGLGMLGRDRSLASPAVVGMPALLERNVDRSDARLIENGASDADELGTAGSIELPSRRLIDAQSQQSLEGVLPNWDRESRTFLVGEYLIKRFRVPSPNQESVLDAFQEEGWPQSIDDPLPPSGDQHPKRCLRDTIKCLNLNQASRMIRFHGDGTGQRVLWQLLSPPLATAGTAAAQPRRRAA